MAASVPAEGGGSAETTTRGRGAPEVRHWERVPLGTPSRKPAAQEGRAGMRCARSPSLADRGAPGCGMGPTALRGGSCSPRGGAPSSRRASSARWPMRGAGEDCRTVAFQAVLLLSALSCLGGTVRSEYCCGINTRSCVCFHPPPPPGYITFLPWGHELGIPKFTV